MNHGIKVTIYPVKDITQAKVLYNTLLGVAPYTDEVYYVGFRLGNQEVGLDPSGHGKGLTGPVGYWQVDDIRQSLQQLVEAGAQPLQEIRDTGNGRLIASVKDADGNDIGLMQEP